MTHIEQLELKNFKSFGGITRINVPPGFNCVIGPNGSGKSNVLDALLFVCGAMSKKGLRTDKLQHLIFNSKDAKKAKDAHVSITINNEDKLIPIDAKSIKITRTVDETGSSEYTINNEKVARNQVTDILSRVGIRTDGHNIVLQGEIDRIVDMSSEERKKMIENLSGISIYEEKKDKAMKELKEVDSRLREAGILLKERQKYLSELEKEKRQAEKYNELEKAIKIKKATRLSKIKETFEKSINEINQKIGEENKRIEELNKEFSGEKQKESELQEKFKEIEKEIESRGEKKHLEIQKKVNNSKMSLIETENSIENIKNQTESIEKRKKEMIEEIKKQKENLSSLKKKKEELEKENKEILKKVEEDEKVVNSSKYHEETLYRIQNDLLKYNQLFEKAVKKKESEKEFEKINSELNEKSEKQKKLNEAVSKIIEIKKKTDSAIDETVKQKKEIEDKLMSAVIENKARRDSLWQGTQEILEMRDNKKIDGIYGAVSELAKVKKEHSLSMQIAAGPKLNYVVVENENTAIKCIEYLKKSRKGFATFIPLSKIKSKPISEKSREFVKIPGVVGFAKELIKFDSKFENIFDYVFGSTLIVDNFQTAKKIGIGNIEMVTNEGDIIKPSGTMTGGFRNNTLASFSTEELEKEEKMLRNHLSEIENALIELEKEKKSSETELLSMKENKLKIDSELNLVKNKAKELVFTIKKLDVKEEPKELEKEIKKLNSQMKELKNLPKDYSKEEIEKIEKELKETREKSNQISIEIKTSARQIESIISPDIKKMSKLIDGFSKEKESFSKKLEELKEKSSKTKEEIKSLEIEEKQFVGKYDDLIKERSDLNNEIKKLDKNQDEVRERMEEIEDRVNTIKIKRAEESAKLEGVNQRFIEFEGIEIEKENKYSPEVLEKQVSRMETALESFGAINEKALTAFQGIEKEFKEAEEKVSKIDVEKNTVLEMVEEIEKKKSAKFLDTLNRIQENFKRIFSGLSEGGWVELIVENKDNPLEEGFGVDIKAKPKGKDIRTIRSLSGGEKTITALAFIFAIQEFEPAPFYVMDEIDAALDKTNSVMLAKLIREYSKNSQFIVISHNNDIFSMADSLYGISMNKEGYSQAVGIKLPK